MESETFARSLYGRWENFYAQSIEQVARRVLDRLELPTDRLDIDRLELDLGVIRQDQLETLFPVLWEKRLEEALMALSRQPRSPGVIFSGDTDYLFSLLCQFLLHGSLPWNVPETYKNISTLFLAVLKERPKILKTFLVAYGHYTGLRQRLVYRLNDSELERGVRLVAPHESEFICSYIRLLRLKYREVNRPQLQASDYRVAVWMVVYNYLLTHVSSFFDKKSFLQTTITRLAARYNLSYGTLLLLINKELDRLLGKSSVPAELFLLLGHLEWEQTAKNSHLLSLRRERLYKWISGWKKKEKPTATDVEMIRQVRLILGQTGSCCRFIAPVKEKEIRKLVRILFPGESDFVIEYAAALDRNPIQKAWEGKAGSEFRLLKWQIIFPVLSVNRGTFFNQIAFTREILHTISAHYNLNFPTVLEYLYNTLELLPLSAMLKKIFTLLREELRSSQVGKISSNRETAPVPVMDKIRKREHFTLQERLELAGIMKNSATCNSIVGALSEEEHLYLVALLLPAESQFIRRYVTGLNYQKTSGILSGRAPTDYQQLKWEFIYSVLLQTTDQVFNKKIFVEHTLQKLGNHYNIGLKQLLNYFYRDERLMKNIFSFDLYQVIIQLYCTYCTREVGESSPKISGRKVKASGNREIYLLLSGYVDGDPCCEVYLKKLSRYPAFIRYIRDVLMLEKELRQFIFSRTGIQVNRAMLLTRLVEVADRFCAFTCPEIMARLTDLLLASLLPGQQPFLLEEMRRRSLLGDKQAELLKKTVERKGALSNGMPLALHSQLKGVDDGVIPVTNAGVVLLSPFLPMLFSKLELTSESGFRDTRAQLHALFLLHYLATGLEELEEPDALLYKLLTGIGLSEPLPYRVELKQEEKAAAVSLLSGVISHWKKLQHTSIEGLRESFLQRSGSMRKKEDRWIVVTEEKGYDVLLDTIPWSFKQIRYSWMDTLLQVKWR